MNKTSIEWTDYSSNPIYAVRLDNDKRGWHCSHASEGCRNCYAEAINKRFGTGLAYTAQNDARVRFELSMKECDALLALDARLHKQGKTARVFVGDMTDILHRGVSDDHVVELFKLFARCTALTIQLLTKRAERLHHIANRYPGLTDWPHVWLGVSAEDQKTFAERWGYLRDTPAAVRFLSLEPLLGPIDMQSELWEDLGPFIWPNWIIVGGESGPSARACDIENVRSIVEQCRSASLPCFVKQLGAKPFMGVKGFGPDIRDRKGGDWNEWPDDLRVREFPSPPHPRPPAAPQAERGK